MKLIQALKKYMTSIYTAIGWSVIILILISIPGSLLPHEQIFFIPGFDKLVHMALFGGFVFLWCFYYGQKQLTNKKRLRLFFRIFVIGSLYGIATEYIQKYFIPGRDYDVADILADIIGAAIAYGISNISLLEEP